LFSSVRATPIPADTESLHSSRSDDQSDSRTEHSDEDAADKAPQTHPERQSSQETSRCQDRGTQFVCCFFLHPFFFNS